VEQALTELGTLPYKDLGYARVDHHRALRQGMPEVVWAEGKSPEQVVGVAEELLRGGHDVLVTRLSAEAACVVTARLPSMKYNAVARTAKLEQRPKAPRDPGFVAVVTAGTSDIPVAEEALETLSMCGIAAESLYDVGVAGLHRLLGEVERLRQARAVIVVAGMEGALASVIGGLVAAPVIAVPTSVGYGVALGGITTLFAMLTSCASGLTVVNIDNGFGAAMAVVRILTSQRAASPVAQ
jgi:NCAIR mutase (PurE)-related protein